MRLFLTVLALGAVAESTLIADLKELVELRDRGDITSSEFTQLKARIVQDGGGTTAAGATPVVSEKMKAILTDVVADIMLGDAMTEVLTSIVSRSLPVPRRQGEEGGTSPAFVECRLHDCGDASVCSARNDKPIENVRDCVHCGMKKLYANDLDGCTCSHTCSAFDAASASSSSSSSSKARRRMAVAAVVGAASANLGDPASRATIWIEDEQGGIAIGRSADVSLRKTAAADGGWHGLRANANLTVDGEVVVDGRPVRASLEQLDTRLKALDAVAVKSSSAGSQQLGSVTANALALAGGLKLGARLDSTPCGPDDDGTLMWSATGVGSVNVCVGKKWRPIYEPPKDGSTIGKAGKTCKTIQDETHATRNGLYWIKPDPSRDAFQATCEMIAGRDNNDGGGWTLLFALPMNGKTQHWTDLSKIPDIRAVTSFGRGNPNSAGLYSGSLAFFSEWREDILSGGRSVWVDCTRTEWNQDLAVTSVEDCMNTVRRGLGYNTGEEDRAKKVLIGCEWDVNGQNLYADATHVRDCCGTGQCPNPTHPSVIGWQRDLATTTTALGACWMGRGNCCSGAGGTGNCGADSAGNQWGKMWAR